MAVGPRMACTSKTLFLFPVTKIRGVSGSVILAVRSGIDLKGL